MLVEEEFHEILKTVKRLVASKKSPCLLEQILLEYMQLKGKKIPFKKFGYVSELELFLERGGRGAGDLFALKDRKGKLYIELRKSNEILSTAIKTKKGAAAVPAATTMKIRKAKSSPFLYNEGKKNDKTFNIITKRKASSSTNTIATSSFDKVNLKTKDMAEKRKPQSQQNGRENKSKILPTLNHVFNPINQTKTKKAAIKLKSTKSDSLVNNKTKQQRQTQNHCHQNDNENVIGSTPLTQVKSLPQYYHTESTNVNGQMNRKLNFLDWHLINILHTKVMAHPNGFYAHQLPDWYQQTFDRHIEENWFDLINRSNEFIQEKDENNKILLFAKNDLDIENIIRGTESKSPNENYKDYQEGIQDYEEGEFDADEDAWIQY